MVIQHGDKVYWHLTRLGSGTSTEYVDAQAQQLLVLSDDEIEAGDRGFNPDDNSVFTRYYKDIPAGKKCKKIIASYPHIEGTLPIAKETVQVWIDSGTPSKAVVSELMYTGSPAKLLVTFQGNLLLNFAEKKSRTPLAHVGAGNVEAIYSKKPTIPTDEDIEQKAINIYPPLGEYYTGMYVTDCRNSFIKGYKQALKDLGHEKDRQEA